MMCVLKETVIMLCIVNEMNSILSFVSGRVSVLYVLSGRVSVLYVLSERGSVPCILLLVPLPRPSGFVICIPSVPCARALGTQNKFLLMPDHSIQHIGATRNLDTQFQNTQD